MPRLHRRGLLAAGAGALAAPAVARDLPDVVVIGAGAFGGWTALTLRERGARVTLVDAYGPGNPHGSGGGESRNIRAAYADREVYTRWTTDAWRLWHERQAEFRRRLIFETGALRADGAETIAAQRRVYDRLMLTYEVLSPAEAARRWPQVRYDDAEVLFYEPRAGVVKARESMIAVAETFEAKGGRVLTGLARPAASAGGRLQTVTVDGQPVAAGTFVFALGPWLPKLFPHLLGDRIRVPRRELFFLAPAAGDPRYRWDRCPNLSDRAMWTSSDIGGGFKVAPRIRDVPMDPDDGDRLPSHFLLQQVQDYVAAHCPGLVGRPVLSSYVCQLENTDNEHFLIDRHPDWANAWIAGGGSGHAFKMGPRIGLHLADLAAGGAQAPELQAIFGLAAHGPVPKGEGG